MSRLQCPDHHGFAPGGCDCSALQHRVRRARCGSMACSLYITPCSTGSNPSSCRRRAQRPRPAGLAPGVRLYAVGDVHGQDDLLDRMLARIRHDTLAADGLVSATLIMLGDYVDRGHGSARVIERLSTLTDMPFDVRFLKGNHEQAMLDFLADPAAGPVWVQYGGGETMAGYGVKPPAAQAGPQAWREAQEALARAIPDHHRAFLDGLEPYVVEAPYMFVHAGVDPAKPLAQQSEQDFLLDPGEIPLLAPALRVRRGPWPYARAGLLSR